MEDKDKILDADLLESTNYVEKQKIISLNMFIFLSITTLGLYSVWWIYKAWRFFQHKEMIDIMPAVRAIFSIVFLNTLLVKILDLAKEKGYDGNYSPTALFIGFFAVNFLSRLPDPFWLISIFSFVFLIPSFNALNYAKQNLTGFIVTEQTSFSGQQIGLIVVGIIFWGFLIFRL